MDITDHQKLLAIRDYLKAPYAAVSKVVPKYSGTMNSKSLRVMLLLYSSPKQTVADLNRALNSVTPAIKTNIEQLTNLGYVKVSGKQQFISQLQCWRILDSYSLTNKGEQALRCFLNEVDTQS